jgi:uncharacterized protein
VNTLKVVIPGGTGHLGRLLARELHAKGHRLIVLSRNPIAEPWKIVQWDGRTVGEWKAELEGADAVVNLAGRSVDCRYDARHREEIIRSRVDSTRAIGEAIAQCSEPPRVWLQMSTATIYAHRFDKPNDERTGILGGDEPGAPDSWRFSIEVAKAWERALDQATTPRTRKVKLRTAMVMGAERGGAFRALLRHVRLGFGRFGDGRQYVSWIHARDFVRAVEWLLEDESVEGAVNLAAPSPLPMSEFLRDLAGAAGRRLMLPLKPWMVKVGAFLWRTEPELVLKSRRVIPTRLLERGFTFAFPRWPQAARDLVSQWRGGGGAALW